MSCHCKSKILSLGIFLAFSACLTNEETQGLITKRANDIKGSEICDGYDNDGNGFVDETFDADKDGFPTCRVRMIPRDCNDNEMNIYPGASENCGDNIDNDCDGKIDSADDDDCNTSCGAQSLTCDKTIGVCATIKAKCISGESKCEYSSNPSYQNNEYSCNDNLDNDCDGQTDIADDDCKQFGACAASDNPKECYKAGTAKPEGVCKGEMMSCVNGYWNCNFSAIANFESSENSVDQLDNDCDGKTDEQDVTFSDGLHCVPRPIESITCSFYPHQIRNNQCCGYESPTPICYPSSTTILYEECEDPYFNNGAECCRPACQNECSSNADKGCDGARQRWSCSLTDGCYKKRLISCGPTYQCINNSGVCTEIPDDPCHDYPNIEPDGDSCVNICMELSPPKNCARCPSNSSKYACVEPTATPPDCSSDSERPNHCSCENMNQCAGGHCVPKCGGGFECKSSNQGCNTGGSTSSSSSSGSTSSSGGNSCTCDGHPDGFVACNGADVYQCQCASGAANNGWGNPIHTGCCQNGDPNTCNGSSSGSTSSSSSSTSSSSSGGTVCTKVCVSYGDASTLGWYYCNEDSSRAGIGCPQGSPYCYNAECHPNP